MFYRFENQDDFLAALPKEVTPSSDFTFEGCNVSVIGYIVERYEPVLDSEGNQVEGQSTPVYKAGWHVNAIGNVPATWESKRVYPTAPLRIFG